MSAKLTTEQFIAQAKIVHGDTYDYSELIYKGSKAKVEIICRKHGSFWQETGSHIKGRGCSKCAREASRLTAKEFITNAQTVHGNTYDYSNAVYTTAKTKVEIKCKIHGSFWQTPDAHVRRCGCPKCGHLITSSASLLEEPTILYYVKFSTYEGPLYKIGITIARRGVITRFTGRQIPPFEILSETIYPTGYGAFQEEQRLHREHREFQYKGPKVLPGGNTELFTKDVLNLDSQTPLSLTGI